MPSKFGASDALAKIRAVVPPDVAAAALKATVQVPYPLEKDVGFGQHVRAIRTAIRECHKRRISDVNAQGERSERTIWPLGLYLYSHVTLVCAWCEVRQGFRAFRAERIEPCEPLDARFDGKNGGLMQAFLKASQQLQSDKMA